LRRRSGAALSYTSGIMKRRLIFAVLFALSRVCAQPAPTADIELGLRKLDELGTVLMIAAHPDDERTNVLAYFARGRNMRTAYLSITRT